MVKARSLDRYLDHIDVIFLLYQGDLMVIFGLCSVCRLFVFLKTTNSLKDKSRLTATLLLHMPDYQFQTCEFHRGSLTGKIRPDIAGHRRRDIQN